MPIDEVNELLHAQLPEDDWDSVGGLIYELGHVPPRARRWTASRPHRRAGPGPAHRPGPARPACGPRARRRRTPGREGVMRSGFVTLVGRPNVGKSTLLNQILGAKVSIVSNKPQTTRTQVRGVLTRPEAQVVFVDTPGMHKPRTLLGSRLNDTAVAAIRGVDVAVLVIERRPLGGGDRFVAARVLPPACAWSTRVDAAGAGYSSPLTAAAELGTDEYFPVSARTGEGVEGLVEAIVTRLPEGPLLYPATW